MTELRFLVKYSKVFGIFRLKLAAEVESNMIRAISSGIPPGFTGLDTTSSFGDTCICTSLLTSLEVVIISTRTKSALTVTLPSNIPVKWFQNLCIVWDCNLPIFLPVLHTYLSSYLPAHLLAYLPAKRASMNTYLPTYLPPQLYLYYLPTYLAAYMYLTIHLFVH